MMTPDTLATLDAGFCSCQSNPCGTHLSRGIPRERCGYPSEVGTRDQGKQVSGGVGCFWLLWLLGNVTQSRHRQWSRQRLSALGTHLPRHKGTEVCRALTTILCTGL